MTTHILHICKPKPTGLHETQTINICNADIMMKRIAFGENDTMKDKSNICTNGKYTELWGRSSVYTDVVSKCREPIRHIEIGIIIKNGLTGLVLR